MEVEIVTTKKKLTKSLISQMPGFIDNQYKIRTEHSKILGYASLLDPTSIIEWEKEYYILDLTWKRSGDGRAFYRTLPKNFSKSFNFKSEEDAEEWWRLYTKIRLEALQTHIYI